MAASGSPKEIAIDIYPRRDMGDPNGWLFELARARILFALQTENTALCHGEHNDASSVPSIKQEPADDESILWLASEVRPSVASIRLVPGAKPVEWGHRALRGFAAGTEVTWQDPEAGGAAMDRGFEIETLCADKKENTTTISSHLLAAIESHFAAQPEFRYLVTQRLGSQPSAKFYKERGFLPYRGDETWLAKPLRSGIVVPATPRPRAAPIVRRRKKIHSRW